MKYYAFFLPQFHECQYNNEWWGKGFTEWNNVKEGVPKFKDHHQPRIPSDGYYDLSDRDVISDKFKLAKANGIDGFAIYHYWYEGKRPLGNVMDTILANKDIEADFSLCWANHSWTRSWSNRLGALDVLIEQTYEKTKESRIAHFSYLLDVFRDERYLRINDKVLFQIYQPNQIPDLKNFIAELREFVFEHEQIEIELSAMITAWEFDWTYLDLFDSVTLFQPSLSLFSPLDLFGSSSSLTNRYSFTSISRALPLPLKKVLYSIQDKYFNRLSFYDYDKAWDNLLKQCKFAFESDLVIYPSAFVDFDNTPRYKNRAKIMKGFSAAKFGGYLEELSKLTKEKSTNRIVFINAWNEWGEGMYLENDIRFGGERLREVARCKNNSKL